MGEKRETNGDHVSGQGNTPMSKPAHALEYSKVIEETGANAQDGLTSAEAKSRLEEYGRNELGAGDGVQPGKIFVRQVANGMTLVSDPQIL